MVHPYLLRWHFWRRHGRLVLAVHVCRALMALHLRSMAERVVPAIGGPAVTAVGLRQLLDVLEERAS